jgi:hemerythrin-like domain-containing protein
MIHIGPAPPSSTLDSPIEHLNACHRRIEERLLTLERAGAALVQRPAEALAAIQAAFWFFDSSGANHTADEEDSLFPRLTPHLAPEDLQWLAALEAEHARAEALYDRLKAHVATLPPQPTPAQQDLYAELAAALCSLYRQHIQNEDSRFPLLASRALSPADLDAIAREMKLRRGI